MILLDLDVKDKRENEERKKGIGAKQMSMATYYRLGMELLYIRIHTCHRLLTWIDCRLLEIDLWPIGREIKGNGKEEEENDKKENLNKQITSSSTRCTYTLFLILLLQAEMSRIARDSFPCFSCP